MQPNPSLGDTAQRAAGGLPELVTRYLRPGGGQPKRQDLLRSWGTPIVLLPCSSTPVGPTYLAIAMRRRGPRCVHDEGSRIRTFEAQSHGFGTGCLRFAVELPSLKEQVASRGSSTDFSICECVLLLFMYRRSAQSGIGGLFGNLIVVWRSIVGRFA